MAFIVALGTYLIPGMASFQIFTWISLAFFSLITALTLYIGLKGLEKNSYGFVASVNGIVLVKLMLSAVLVLVYVLIERPKDPKFIIPFFIFYIVFTIFEVREILMAQKVKSRNKE
ncbi:MAG TPA: hypothetical protein PLD84_15610 [Chitinophagales bacterium]|nr:hypothetical protein [Chitinophagales bacterium]